MPKISKIYKNQDILNSCLGVEQISFMNWTKTMAGMGRGWFWVYHTMSSFYQCWISFAFLTWMTNPPGHHSSHCQLRPFLLTNYWPILFSLFYFRTCCLHASSSQFFLSACWLNVKITSFWYLVVFMQTWISFNGPLKFHFIILGLWPDHSLSWGCDQTTPD